MINNNQSEQQTAHDSLEEIEKLRVEKLVMERMIIKLRNDIVQVQGAIELALSMLSGSKAEEESWVRGMLKAIDDKVSTATMDNSDEFLRHLRSCSEEVSKWPVWKQQGADVTKFQKE